ncbi:MAG TPA: MFS transporter [Gaiellaceae bacterium]|nr:MFS transporter [Gaiellaceae bacterium]
MSARAVAGGSAVGFAAGWNIADTGAVADELAEAYGVGLGVVGLFTAVLFLVHLLMQLPAGRLSDRLGPTRVCAAGLAVMALGNALASVAPEPWLGLTARALIGVGTALGFIAGSDFVRATGGSPFAQGLYGGLATAGGGVAIAVVPVLEGALGWRTPFVSAIAVATVAAVLLAAAPWPARAAPAAAGRVPLPSLARDRRLLRLAAVFGASFGLSVVIGNWVVTLLERQTSVSDAAAGAIGASTLVLGVVSRPLGGWIVQRRPARANAAVGAAALAGAAGTIALAATSIPLAAAGACLVGLAAGIPFAYSFTGAARLVPEAPATAIGLVNAAGALTVVAGSALVGVAFAAGVGTWAFAAMAALWAASAVLARPAPRPRPG